tara:strand:- start:286 stop:507 length:222 start_codon:yes stop_codon:yes gene_type:complete
MGTYLFIGFIVILFIVNDIEEFISGLVSGREELQEQFPDMPSSFITFGLCFISILFIVLWPVTVIYLMFKLTE